MRVRTGRLHSLFCFMAHDLGVCACLCALLLRVRLLCVLGIWNKRTISPSGVYGRHSKCFPSTFDGVFNNFLGRSHTHTQTSFIIKDLNHTLDPCMESHSAHSFIVSFLFPASTCLFLLISDTITRKTISWVFCLSLPGSLAFLLCLCVCVCVYFQIFFFLLKIFPLTFFSL